MTSTIKNNPSKPSIAQKKPVAKPAAAPIKTVPTVALKTTVKNADDAKITAKVAPPKAAAKTVTAPSKAPKTEKTKKIKLIRDSFTIPKPEFVILDELKQRALNLKHSVKKGELLRAGIKALHTMSDEQFMTAIQAVPNLKTGRPSKKA